MRNILSAILSEILVQIDSFSTSYSRQRNTFLMNIL